MNKMIKSNKILIINIVFMLFSIGWKDNNDKTVIYQTLFKHMSSFSIIKLDPPDDYVITVKGSDLVTFKKEMENINKITQYEDNADRPSGYEEDIHHLIINYEQPEKRPTNILYSTKKQVILVRGRDIFPNIQETPPKILVYKLEMSQKAKEILIKHENRLPKEGFFPGNWPFNSLFRGDKS